MVKSIAYVALHYGSDYLASAIRSVIDDVDELWVLYTPVGSHGTRTDAVCPDTRETLYAIALAAATWKLHWVDGEWPYEGAQRDAIHALVPDADVVLVLDADELWPAGLARACIDAYHNLSGHPWRYRLPMIHLWRSLNRAILHDPAFPERVIYPQAANRDIGYFDPGCGPIVHAGYAQRSEIVEYKLKTHGHIGQFRTDVDWFRDVFMDETRRSDLHPVGSDYWNAEDIDILDYLPSWITEHPYYGLGVIP